MNDLREDSQEMFSNIKNSMENMGSTTKQYLKKKLDLPVRPTDCDNLGVRNSAPPSQIGAEQMRLACGKAISKGIREGLEKGHKEMAKMVKAKNEELLRRNAKEFNSNGFYK